MQKDSRTEGTEDVFSKVIKPALFKAVHEKRMYHNINKRCRSPDDDHQAAANLVRSAFRVYPPFDSGALADPPVDDRQLPNVSNTGGAVSARRLRTLQSVATVRVFFAFLQIFMQRHCKLLNGNCNVGVECHFALVSRRSEAGHFAYNTPIRRHDPLVAASRCEFLGS
jgi:hypothetical protein